VIQLGIGLRDTLTVLVCGGREYQNYEVVKAALDDLESEHGIRLLVSGGCTGADRLARRWAEERGFTPGPSRARPRVWLPKDVTSHKVYMEYPALWGSYGRAAGPVRNKEMLAETHPDIVLAFPGGDGTDGMKKLARKAGVKVAEHG